jgi:hypothetical protein
VLAKLSDTVQRRVAVILGAGGFSQVLFDVLRPLLSKDDKIDLQGVFVIEDDLQHAASLPFVKELCRLTLNVREFQNTQFERAIALRTRSAQKAISGLALRMGVSHTFRNVRGSTISLLQKTALSADITVFEPQQVFAATSVLPPAQTRGPQQRVVVAIDEAATGAKALIAAALLAEGEMHRVTIILTAATLAERERLNRMISDLFPADPARILLLAEPGVRHLIAASRAEDAGMLVIGTSEELLKPESLNLLREQLSCPICLVRKWDGDSIETE